MKIVQSKQTEQQSITPLNEDETAYLLRSPANAEHLRKSIAQLRMNQRRKRTLIDN